MSKTQMKRAASKPPKTLRAAVYGRISSDRTGQAVNATTQIGDCRETADRYGYDVVAEYVDNDKSAFKGKFRPQWSQLLSDAEEGRFDVIIAWHDDRLWRDVTEQQLVFAMCRDVGVAQIIAGSRVYDTSSADDNFLSGIQALMAQRESADKSRRIRRKHAALAAEGKVGNGGPRPFGYEHDRVTIKADEAALIREAAKRVLAGESMQLIIRDWHRRGVKTSTGKTWKTTSFRRMLYSARIAGLREHKGEVVADAVWPGIISRSDHERIRKLLDGRARGFQPPRSYLLSGMIRCGKPDCGAMLASRPKRDRQRMYVCNSSPDHGGCGGIAIIARYAEDTVRDYVIEALSGEGLARAIEAANADDTEQHQLTEQLTDDQAALEELTQDFYVNKLLDRASFIAARQTLEARLEATKRALNSRSNAATLAGLPTSPTALRAAWDSRTDPDDVSYGLAWRRALVDAVIDYVTILPAGGGNKFNPDRVKPHWKV